MYNTEDFIKECLDTILSQSFTDFEVIIINDGSTDKSVQHVERMMMLDNRIFLIHQENSGASVARNKGIMLAKAKYIAFVDSDDFIHHKAFENLLEIAEKNNSDIVLGKRQWNIDNKSVPDNNLIKLFSKTVNTTNVTKTPGIIKVIAVHGKLFSKKFLHENDLNFPVGMSSEDFVFTYKAYAKANIISIIPDIVYSYRRRTSDNKSITQNRLSEYNLKSRFKQMSMTEDICKKKPTLNISQEKEFKKNYNARLVRHILAITSEDEQSRIAINLIHSHIKGIYNKIYHCVDVNNKIRYILIYKKNLKGLSIFNNSLNEESISVISVIKLIITLRSCSIAKLLLKKKVNL